MAEYYTPADLARFKAQMEQNYYRNNMLNNDLSTISNMTKNISPLGNLGIMLGTLGGKWAAQRYNDNQFENFLKAYDRYKLNQKLVNNNIFDKSANWINQTQTQNLPTFADAKNQFTNNSSTPSNVLFHNQNKENFSAPDVSLFDWRNQNYFSNVKRPSFLSIN